ncbi:MAG: tRNA (guanosine(37)-N1)-methyltransferase TrmD [Cellulomonadaceae bacterium]|jgi:tRNA (guanine37-N1)-methyltransferase|nr:tRNA (guanosine(37)-N1)-methyltransferase TrmD [Cellulomonadaceae bacterium]
MRIDIVSVFPEYLAPLQLSLIGKAATAGVLDIAVHDLRNWTTDKHRTVDDTPFGGGAGMVMKPDVWGRAIDDLATEDTVLVLPTPSGEVFTQGIAESLKAEQHLLFACGRYEGIDARVAEHYAASGMTVRELSLGDYVLNGGEVAALVMVEAIGRLVPGVIGNPESLVEESHGPDGLLEYPVYTKPPQWRGLNVPDVLLSGHHAKVAQWRQQQARERTAARRPDLWAKIQG